MASSQTRKKLPDAEAIEEDERQYPDQEELDQKNPKRYPNRPHNHSKTLPFHELFTTLFNPLADQKKTKAAPIIARKKVGRHGPNNVSPQEERRNIVIRFISRWRSQVGDDFYPAIRLILPDKDRDRAMYGMKEISIAKLIVKLLNLHKESDDGYNLLNWKLPHRGPASASSAGDFAGRCYEVLAKRPMRQKVGDMRIGEVNELLDKLSKANKEEGQLPIFREFYQRMNAEELMWLIRIILRQMKIGATEKTLLTLWHKDGETLFNVSSSLRRVCWELSDPTKSLDDDEAGVELMSCFQPQLAQFMAPSFEKMVANMRPEGDDDEFWIEEKLDGERMQMHMIEDDDVPCGRRFGWWSRKGKDYTYLYGHGLEDDDSSMTRHMKDAFDSRVKNIILDGEMITWDPTTNKMVPFGTLKSAAISGKKDPFSDTENRPLFRIFDCLYINGQDITKYTLRDRRKVLETSVKNIHLRFELHTYSSAHSAAEIDPALRKIVAESSEGLVLKNPRSMYRLNSRNDDWMKVKPEYMTGFGESLDCVVIGGYYGSGHRGGNLSSFLCGLRVDAKERKPGDSEMKCYSFFKVGGGFNAEDYAAIRHQTNGKWIEWDAANPPKNFIELAGPNNDKEKPDVWIKPCDSIVIEAKAASVGVSDSFRTKFTLRFPRFKRLRPDKDWTTALTVEEFLELKAKVEEDSKNNEFKVDKKKRGIKRLKREKVIAGANANYNPTAVGQSSDSAAPNTRVFEGLNFCVLSEMMQPVKKSKTQLEELIKRNGGAIYQNPKATIKGEEGEMIVVGEKRVVKVASLVKEGRTSIVKGKWVLDAVAQMERDRGRGGARWVVPWEEGHMFFVREEDRERVAEATDRWGDAWGRDVDGEEVRGLVGGMEVLKLEGEVEGQDRKGLVGGLLKELQDRGRSLGVLKGMLFRNCTALVVGDVNDAPVDVRIALNWFEFAGGKVLGEDSTREIITHIIFTDEEYDDEERIREIKGGVNGSPVCVGWRWIRDSWDEGKRVDEGLYVVGLGV
ncbi:dna ligase 4 protein [Rutstroemia sp. NJR-2017a BBW]|nr:dna ligase 4 protein [Rutstroemia sp. NJR-2017a BBW]